jgi:D-alanyl-lipoteichoic acid acyltransferase DltB (MBOAT superfamily)
MVAVIINLCSLGFYKYLFPFLNFLGSEGLIAHNWTGVILPLGISFFTFTQIGYLVDLRQGEAEPQGLLNYTLFVTFFPHLIAGPIVHHKEMMPQFGTNRRYTLRPDDVAVGLTWFVFGLAKKTLFADRVGRYADPVFASGLQLNMLETWIGVLAYSLQLYFDFSGYSDMALGLARMFSIQFPINFNSPYKATNIIDFWQRWHMTLTRYITLYLYNPLALSVARRRLAAGKKVSTKSLKTPSGFFNMLAIPTMFTMGVVGIWHGAGSQFLIFGALHGAYLCVNHAWRSFAAPRILWRPGNWWQKASTQVLSVAITFLCVLVGQVFFRASSTSSAWHILGSMVRQPSFSLHGPSLVHMSIYPGLQTAVAQRSLTISFLFVIVWLLPNTQQILGRFSRISGAQLPRMLERFAWQPSIGWAFTVSALLLLAIVFKATSAAFLYFQF